MYENLKPYILGILTVLTGIIYPIQNVLIVLTATFIFNIVIGFRTDKTVNHINFSLKKAFSAIQQMTFIMVFVYYTHGVFEELKMDILGHEVIKWVALLAVYFYTTNIFRNMTEQYPKNKFFEFVYAVLTTQIFSMIKRALFMDLKGGSNGQ